MSRIGQSKRGQTTVELLLLLGVSLIALLIIYSLYGQQIQFSSSVKEITTAKSTIDRMVTAANSLSISGAGSRTTVLIELPTSLRMDDSGIYGNEIILKLRNRTDIVGSADVNFSGTWKRDGNSFVKGGYYATFVFDGNAVNIIYDDFDLSTGSISIQSRQSTITQSSFTIRNNSSNIAYFTITPSFSNDPYALLSLGAGDESFSLSEREIRLVDLNITTNSSAYGNYSGALDIEAQLNDNYRDYNISKQVTVSAEVFINPEEVMLYPHSRSYALYPGEAQSQAFSLCNSGDTNVVVTWSKDTNADANMLLWFSLPPSDSDGAISVAYAGGCRYFDLNVSVPLGTVAGNYDANFTVSYGAGGASTAYLYATVYASLVQNYGSIFFTAQDDFDTNANLLLSKYFRTTSTYGGEVIPSGELDWNLSARNDTNYTSWSGQYLSDYNLPSDTNLVGLWHLNDKNATEWVLNSVTNTYDGNLVGGADVNGTGLWGTNAGWFNGSTSKITIAHTTSNTFTTLPFTLSAWIKVNKSGYATLFSKDNGGAAGGWTLVASTSYVRWINHLFSDQAFASSALPANTWLMLTITRNGDNMYMYINGSYISSLSVPSGNYITTYPLSIGAQSNFSNFFGGYVDEATIWKRTLSASEVLALYQSQKGRWFDTNLVGYWKFNLASGTTILDSARGHNGTLVTTTSVNTQGFWDSNALSLIGSTMTVADNSSLDFGTGDFSTMFWVYPSNSGLVANNEYGVINKNTTFQNSAGWGIETSTWGKSSPFPNVSLYVYNTGQTAWCNTCAFASITTNAWHHIGTVRSGTTLNIYVDGNLVSSKTHADVGLNVDNAVAITFGGHSWGPNFPGKIEESKLFNRALSATEISADYNQWLNAKYRGANTDSVGASVTLGTVTVNKDLNYNFNKELEYCSGACAWDTNMIGLWHLNAGDKNATNWVKNSVTNTYDGNLVGGADTNAFGLWGTNSGWFNGLNSDINLGNYQPFKDATRLTVSAWFYRTGTNPENALYLISKRSSTGAENGSFLFLYTPTTGTTFVGYNKSDSSTDCSITSATSLLPLGNWVNLTTTYSGTNCYLYANGILVASGSGVSAYSPSSNNFSLLIGNSNYRDNNGAFNGRIEDVAIWKTALTANQVLDLYRKGVSKLDLNIFTCSDVNCGTLTGSQYFTDLNNNTPMSLSLPVSRYFSYEVLFGQGTGFDRNAETYFVGPVLHDLNISYSS